MKGLIIKDPWITHILNGSKTWEIRGSATKTRGLISLIKSGTGHIYGTANLVDCKGPFTNDEFKRHQDKHLVADLSQVARYKKVYVWVLSDAQKLPEPIPYDHPQGAIIWVNIPDIHNDTSDPKFDPIIDAFIKGNHDLVKVEVPRKGGRYLGGELRNRVFARNLEKKILVQVVNGVCYLEKK